MRKNTGESWPGKKEVIISVVMMSGKIPRNAIPESSIKCKLLFFSTENRQKICRQKLKEHCKDNLCNSLVECEGHSSIHLTGVYCVFTRFQVLL